MAGSKQNANLSVPGYDFGSPEIAQSPLSSEDLAYLEQTLGWRQTDRDLLRKHAAVFQAQAEQMVDAWRAIIGSQAHLSKWFAGQDGKPDDEYKARVRRRFVQWVVDVATRPHDRTWLNYQEEIGLRHTPDKKNKTDGAHTPAVVPLRYLLAFIPVVSEVRRFLEVAISDQEELAAVEDAWRKAVQLHVILWSRPYTRDGLW